MITKVTYEKTAFYFEVISLLIHSMAFYVFIFAQFYIFQANTNDIGVIFSDKTFNEYVHDMPVVDEDLVILEGGEMVTVFGYKNPSNPDNPTLTSANFKMISGAECLQTDPNVQFESEEDLESFFCILYVTMNQDKKARILIGDSGSKYLLHFLRTKQCCSIQFEML